MDKLTRAKMELYGMLLRVEDPSVEELEVMFHLALDQKVKEELSRRIAEAVTL